MIRLAKTYPLITQCLQGLKGLTEEEARAFFEICSRKSVTVKEVMKIFTAIKSEVSRSKAYTIVEKFENSGLIFADTSSKKKEYKAIHPRTLLNILNSSLKKIEKEITELEESYETSDFEEADPRQISKTLHSENEIMTICNILNKDHDITIISDKTPKVNDFLDGLSCGKLIKGKVNVILFNNKKNGKKGVINISKRYDKEGNLRIFGQILYDEDKYKYYLKNELKNNG